MDTSSLTRIKRCDETSAIETELKTQIDFN